MVAVSVPFPEARNRKGTESGLASTQHNCEVPPPGVYILHYIALMLDLAAEDAKKQAMEGDSRYNFA